MRNGQVVIDSVIHAFNLSDANMAVEAHARPIAELTYALQAGFPAGYPMTREELLRDWDVDDLARMTFGESNTDFAVYHPTPIFAFNDGLSSADKAVELLNKYPDRMLGSYVALDPLQGDAAFEELNRRCDEYQPLGVKLYPTSWNGGTVSTWRMDDPKITYPLYEAAAEKGIKTIAVHKALPVGPPPTGQSYRPDDVEGAASAFPELNFEIVHGGAAFTEETAWLLGRFQNIYVNLETLTTTMVMRPDIFARMVCGMMHVGGEPVLDRLLWSTGSMQVHPRLCMDAFENVTFPEAIRSEFGLFGALPDITEEHRNNILGNNYLRMHDIDVEAKLKAIADDEFAAGKSRSLPEPFSTTSIGKRLVA